MVMSAQFATFAIGKFLWTAGMGTWTQVYTKPQPTLKKKEEKTHLFPIINN